MLKSDHNHHGSKSVVGEIVLELHTYSNDRRNDAFFIKIIDINQSVLVELYAKPHNYHYFNNKLLHLQYTMVYGVLGVGTRSPFNNYYWTRCILAE